VNTTQIVGLIGAVLLIFFMTNSWRFASDISSFVKEFRVNKKRGLKFSMCGCCLKRQNKMDLWNGLGQIATNGEGIYYSSICMPLLFIPWGKLNLVKLDNQISNEYSHVTIAGYPAFTWLIPARFNLKIDVV
jgi:hypothetical protein